MGVQLYGRRHLVGRGMKTNPFPGKGPVLLLLAGEESPLLALVEVRERGPKEGWGMGVEKRDRHTHTNWMV